MYIKTIEYITNSDYTYLLVCFTRRRSKPAPLSSTGRDDSFGTDHAH